MPLMDESNENGRGELTIVPIADTAAIMPLHGTVSTRAATRWEDSLAAGNGIMGGLLAGDPRLDTLIATHCKLWLPLGSREVVPNTASALAEMRAIIAARGYQAGQDFFLAEAKRQGWDGRLVWTDPFHPGFFLNIRQPQDAGIADYARVENFSTGEVWAQWSAGGAAYTRRMFVSQTDNAIVVVTAGPKGGLDLRVEMAPVGNDGIARTLCAQPDTIAAHNVYVHGKGGYDAAVRIVAHGGSQSRDGDAAVTIEGADSVLLIARIQPWKAPIEGSDAWPYSPDNPDFARDDQVAGLYRAADAYNPAWMTDLTDSLATLPADYQRLFKPHATAWGDMFFRVSLDLRGSQAERGLSSEALLDLAQSEQRLPGALLERMYDAGRYVYMCSAGPETPPNLFGIWTGTWEPAWSGDYTTDTNLQLDIECAHSAGMHEKMAGYFNLWDSYVPDFRTNARRLYGCRGILAGSRASNTGLALHWDASWPGNLWTAGAAWIAHWYYDHYLYTGDERFLRDRAIPFMAECALFYEDFLAGTENGDGICTFRPSYSAENGWGDNASQDIEIATELFENLIAACETLGIKEADASRWKAVLAKLPPLLIDDDGALKEWANRDQGEKNDHRHLMHLYGAFECRQFTREKDADKFEAAKRALLNRVDGSTEDATHGFMHCALAAVGLGMGNLAYSRLAELAKRRSIYSNMVDAHYGGPRVLCDDGNGATPEIVNRMIVQSEPGRLFLLPALPDELPRGTLSGARARGGVLINCIAWDTTAGAVRALITSDRTQTVDLVLPADASAIRLTVGGRRTAHSAMGARTHGCRLLLNAGKPVLVKAKFSWHRIA
jgi:hypothetical protein